MNYKLTQKQIQETIDKGANSLFEYCREHSKNYLVTGVSGGLDSAVTLAIAEISCKIAFQNGFKLIPIGLVLPCHSPTQHAKLARQAIRKFGAEEITIELTDAYDFLDQGVIKKANQQIVSILNKYSSQAPSDWDKKIASGNIKARLRMLCGTYHVAKMLNGIVLSTDNLSEYLMGFWTLNGDVGDFGVIQQIFKGIELYDIARYLEVPEGIIDAKPTDGLGISDGDEAQLGTDYRTVDRIMVTLIKNGFDPDGTLEQLRKLPVLPNEDQSLVYSLAERCLKNSYKRKGCQNLSRQNLNLREIKEMATESAKKQPASTAKQISST